jgi:hypothetical protein
MISSQMAMALRQVNLDDLPVGFGKSRMAQ